jgi:hypothetical protein
MKSPSADRSGKPLRRSQLRAARRAGRKGKVEGKPAKPPPGQREPTP